MKPENELEIKLLTEESVLEAMRNKKLKPELKAKIGMEYMKHTHSIKLDNLSAVVKVASLYPEYRREEFAKKIIPPRYEVLDTDIEVVPGTTFEEVAKSIKEANQVKQDSEQKVQKLDNLVADLKDELATKDKAKAEETAKQEYEQKRDY